MQKLLLGVLLLGVSQLAGAETYKCTVKGKILYTNQTPDTAAKCEALFTRKQPVTESGVVSDAVKKDGGEKKAEKTQEKTQADKELEAKLKKTDVDVGKKKAEEDEARQKVKAQNCQTAKRNVETLKVGRVARMNEKGEKYYLDAAAIAQEMEQTNRDIAQWCGE